MSAMTAPQLRRADDEDASVVHGILAAAGARLAEQGFANWQPPYPLARVMEDITKREVHLVVEGDEPVATFILRTAPPRPYDPPPWPDPELPALYLNRLAVHPRGQGRGLGAWCLAAVDLLARARRMHAVRCDVLLDNVRMRGLYERHGYVMRGERSHSGWRFACYERIV